MNKIETHLQADEIKKIWSENREILSTYAIWKNLILEQYSFKQSDMFIFYQTVQRWEKERAKEMVKKMSHWEIKRLQEENKKIATILLNHQLKNGLESLKSKKSAELVGKVLKLFSQIEEIRAQELIIKEKAQKVKMMRLY